MQKYEKLEKIGEGKSYMRIYFVNLKDLTYCIIRNIIPTMQIEYLLFYISEKLLTSCTVQLNVINSSNERIIVVIVKTKLCVTVLLRPWDISWDWN